jgi:hypothetical protein
MPIDRLKVIGGNRETWRKRFHDCPTAELEEFLITLPDCPKRQGAEFVLRDRLDIQSLLAFQDDIIQRLKTHIECWLKKQPKESLDYIAANTKSKNLRRLTASLLASTESSEKRPKVSPKPGKPGKRSPSRLKKPKTNFKKNPPPKPQRVKSKKKTLKHRKPSIAPIVSVARPKGTAATRIVPVVSVLRLNATAASERPYQDPTMPYSQKWDMPEWDGS